MDIPNQLGSSEIWKGASAKDVVGHLVGAQSVSPVRQIALTYGSVTQTTKAINVKIERVKLTDSQVDKLYDFLRKL